MKIEFTENLVTNRIVLRTERVSYFEEWEEGLEYSAHFTATGYLIFYQNSEHVHQLKNSPGILQLLDMAIKLNPNIQRYFQEKDPDQREKLKTILRNQMEFFINEVAV